MAGRGVACPDAARLGMAGVAWPGAARLGGVRHDTARQARRGEAGYVKPARSRGGGVLRAGFSFFQTVEQDMTTRIGATYGADDSYILAKIEGTAHWRREKAKQYPDDARNRRAAEILDEIAEGFRTPSGLRVLALVDDAIGRSTYNSEYDWDSIESEVLRSIGFRSDAEGFLTFAALVSATLDEHGLRSDALTRLQSHIEECIQKEAECIVQDALDEMVLSGEVEAQEVGGETFYSLRPLN